MHINLWIHLYLLLLLFFCLQGVRGTFSLKTTATSSDACQNCPSGWFQSESGQSRCASCPRGTFSSEIAAYSSDSCQTCMMGKFAAVPSGAVSCTDCQLGYWSIEVGAYSGSVCRECPGNNTSRAFYYSRRYTFDTN